MVNPFDRNFFKFFIGFICILSMSFTIIYLVGKYGQFPDGPQAAVGQ